MTAQQLCRLLLTGLCFFATLGTGRAAPPASARPAAQATNAAVLFPAFGFWTNVPGTQAWATTNGLGGGRAGTNSASGHGGVGRPDKDAQPDKGNTGNETAFTAFTVPTPLLAHWRFDETGGTTAADSSGNNLHGTLSASGAAFVPSGMAGNALQLTKSANGTVNMGNVLGSTGGSFSLAVWVRMNAGDTTDASMLVARHAPGYHNGWFLNMNTAGAPWAGQPSKAMFYDSGSDLTGAAVSTTSVNDGQWHHIVVVYHAGVQKRLFVDGSPVEGTGAANGILANNAPFLVGGLLTGGSTPTGYFTGWVDELMVFGTALTSTEVDELYASYVLTAPSTPAGLAAQAGNRQVTLTWSAATPAVTSYRVKRATAAAGPYSVVATPGGPTFVDTGLNNGTTYYYRVSAVNIVGESQDSGFVAATPSALLAHWRFDEAGGTTAADSSGNNFHGTLSPAGAAFVSGGKAGNALQLTKSANGTVNMGAGNALALNGGSFSLAVWVRMNAGDTTDASMIVTRHSPGTLNGWFLNANTAGASWAGQPNKALLFDAGSDLTGSAVSTTSINDGQWHHVVAVYDLGVQKRVYVDGVPVEGTGPANGFPANNAPFLVGGLQWAGTATPSGYFTGWLDELMVFGTALTDAEIGTLYDSYSLPVPNPPASLVAVPGDQQVSLSWSAVAGATSYTVKRALTPTGPFTALPAITATALTDTGLNNGTTYHYVATAWNSTGESAPSPAASATPAAAPTGPPDAPTGLAATAGNQQVTLNWTAVTPGVIAYNVKFSTTAGGTYQAAGTVTAPATTFTHSGLVNGTTYYYVVSAVSSMEGPDSNEASATPTATPPPMLPDAPTILSAVGGNQQVTLSWTTSTPNVTRYDVKRSETPGGPYDVVGFVNAPGTSGVDNQNLDNGTTYYYVVTAVNAAGEADSAEASATPAAPPLTVPTAPGNVILVVGSQQQTLRWDAATPEVTGYKVQRGTSQTGPWEELTASTPNTWWVDTTATVGQTYYYLVSAINGVGEGPTAGVSKVVQEGIRFTTIANGAELSGVVQLPVEVGYGGEGNVLTVTYDLEEGEPRINGITPYIFSGNNDSPNIQFATYRCLSGNYILRPVIYVEGGEIVSGTPVHVTINNPIQIPDISSVLGETLDIPATINAFNAPYTIRIANEQNVEIRTLAGVSNGDRIDAYWDGNDNSGAPAVINNHALLSLSYTTAAAAHTLQWPIAVDLNKFNYLDNKQWLLARQDWMSGLLRVGVLNLFSQVNATLSSSASRTPITIQPHVLANGSGAAWTEFLRLIGEPQCRNLYYWGHASVVALGFGQNDRRNGILAWQVGRKLHNERIAALINGNSVEFWRFANPYRFVFLDGCNTGRDGTRWIFKFGTDEHRTSTAWYTRMNRAPRALVGWNRKIYTSVLDAGSPDFVLRFFDGWIGTSKELESALRDASAVELGKLRIYGAADLKD